MPSILETFYILFESDATDVEVGAKKAKKATNDLNQSLKATDHVQQKVGTGFTNLIRQAVAFFSIGAAVTGFVAAIQYADRLDELSKGLNVNIEDLDAWGNAVKKNGGTVEGFQDTVRGMTSDLAAFATKGVSRSAPFFQDLGIDLTDARGKARSFMDILPELADKFQKLSKEESFGIGQRLGLDQGTILLLQQGRREVEDIIRRQKELGLVTKEDAEQAAKFNDAWDDTVHIFRSIFIQIGNSVLPALTSLMKGFERVVFFFKKHSDLLVGSLIAIGSTILYFVTPAVMSLLVSISPFLLLGAAVVAVGAAFALLYEDIVGFYKGHNSLIGDLIKKWPLLGTILKTIEPIARGLKNAFLSIPEVFEQAWNGLVYLIKNAIPGVMKLIEGLGNAFQKVKAWFLADIPESIEVTMAKGKSFLELAQKNPISSQTSNSILNSSNAVSKNTSVQVGQVTIETQATDAASISKEFSSVLKTQMRQAINNYDDGVLA